MSIRHKNSWKNGEGFKKQLVIWHEIEYVIWYEIGGKTGEKLFGKLVNDLVKDSTIKLA